MNEKIIFIIIVFVLVGFIAFTIFNHDKQKEDLGNDYVDVGNIVEEADRIIFYKNSDEIVWDKTNDTLSINGKDCDSFPYSGAWSEEVACEYFREIKLEGFGK